MSQPAAEHSPRPLPLWEAASDTTLLRCLGALLIINSHLEAYYPRSWLAGDGLLGNALFFSVSGFSLAIAQQRRPRSAGSWLLRRAERIYPALWIVMLIGWLGFRGDWRVWHGIDYACNFLWPTPYTFILGIVPSYLLFLPLVQVNRARAYLIAAACCVVPYAVIYAIGLPSGLNIQLGPIHIRGWLEIIACLAAMFLGAWFALRCLAATRAPSAARYAMLFAAASALYLFVKTSVNVEHRLAMLYPLEHVFALLVLLAMYRLASQPQVARRVLGSRAMRAMGDASLEIYLVHVLLIETALRRLPCPANVLALVLIAVILGIALRQVTRQLLRVIAF